MHPGWFSALVPVTPEPLLSLFLRDPAQNHPEADAPESSIDDETEDDSTEPEKMIICRQCRHVITKPAESIEVQGAHLHTFANPEGLVFEIGCFGFTQGCGFVGPLTDEFTWFKGFSWRVAVCSACLSHLGWLYLSTGSDSFCGLIMDRLIMPT
jgi:hypothetical protein